MYINYFTVDEPWRKNLSGFSSQSLRRHDKGDLSNVLSKPLLCGLNRYGKRMCLNAWPLGVVLLGSMD